MYQGLISLTLPMLVANKVHAVNNTNEPRSIRCHDNLSQVCLTTAVDNKSFPPEPCLSATVYQSNSKAHWSSFFSDIAIVDPESHPPVHSRSFVKCSRPMMTSSILLLCIWLSGSYCELESCATLKMKGLCPSVLLWAGWVALEIWSVANSTAVQRIS